MIVTTAGPRTLTAGPSGSVRWRLVASNGRALGAGVDAHLDALSAQEAFRGLLPRLSAAVPSIAHAAGAPGWVWRLVGAGGVVLARSDRSFERYGSCERSCRSFLQAISVLAAEREKSDPGGTIWTAPPNSPVLVNGAESADDH